jgi:hypothetical protein
MYKIKSGVNLSFCNADVCGSGVQTPRVIQLKVCAHFNAPPPPIYPRMNAAGTTWLEAEWTPEPGWTLWGRKISLAVPGSRTTYCPGIDLVKTVSVCMGWGYEHGTCSRRTVKRKWSLVDERIACRVFTQLAFIIKYEPVVNGSGKWGNMVQGVPG